MDDAEWLTTDEVARRLRVTRQSVTRWIRQGHLRARAIRVHGRRVYRIRPVDYADFIRRYVSETRT